MNLLASFVRTNRAAARWLEAKFPTFFGSESYRQEILHRIESDLRGKSSPTVVEAGGADRPLLHKADGYTYVGIDIDAPPGAYDVYDAFYAQSIEQPLPITADIVISFTLLEHVKNNEAAAASIFASLRPGGVTHHYVPSNWHPYSILLRLLGPAAQKRPIAILRPDAVSVSGYPAYFDHCSPAKMEALLRKAGFTRINIRCYYRASDYFAFFLPFYVLVAVFENICAILRVKTCASGFVISAQKANELPAKDGRFAKADRASK
jgi:hypothetical protein